MAYKDEYEVARLHARTGFAEKLAAEFEGGFHRQLPPRAAAPAARHATPAGGRASARSGRGWAAAFRLLARMKRLRGTPLDPFGHTAERRMERELIGWYEGLLDRCAAEVAPATIATRGRRVLAAPMDIRGYGPVKEAAVGRVKAEVAALLDDLSGVHRASPARGAAGQISGRGVPSDLS